MGHHHFFLLLPIAGAVLLILLPPTIALPVYTALSLSSVATFVRIARSIRLPVTTGREAMLGTGVQVLGRTAGGWQVRHQGELWSARSPDTLLAGQPARIIGVEGLTLTVVREDWDRPERVRQRKLQEARDALAAALYRLKRQSDELEIEARKREEAARATLASDEAAARAYLLQKQALVEARERLLAEAKGLQTSLAQLEELWQEVAPTR